LRGASATSQPYKSSSGFTTWFRILRFYGLRHLTSQEELSFFEWWMAIRKQVHKLQHKEFDSLAILVVWSTWKERNQRGRKEINAFMAEAQFNMWLWHC
jgi:hypothetical protein